MIGDEVGRGGAVLAVTDEHLASAQRHARIVAALLGERGVTIAAREVRPFLSVISAELMEYARGPAVDHEAYASLASDWRRFDAELRKREPVVSLRPRTWG